MARSSMKFRTYIISLILIFLAFASTVGVSDQSKPLRKLSPPYDQLITDNALGIYQFDDAENSGSQYPFIKESEYWIAIDNGKTKGMLSLPTHRPVKAVLYYLLGFACSSADFKGAPQNDLFNALLRRGYAVWRVEKPGINHHHSKKPCSKVSFSEELAGYLAGYEYLETLFPNDMPRILFGHSLGGIYGPMIMQEATVKPKGIAVFGTLARNWHDYYLDILRYQPVWMTINTPEEIDKELEAARPVFRQFLLEGELPNTIMASNPDAKAVFQKHMGMAVDGSLSTRSPEFWIELSKVEPLPIWQAIDGYTLSMYGESDLAALNDTDHRLIAIVRNTFAPDTARFVSLPETNHNLQKVGPKEAYAKTFYQNGAFAGIKEPANPLVIETLADWMAEILKQS